jgi:hypothetical protein
MFPLREIEPEENKLILLFLVAINSLEDGPKYIPILDQSQEIDEKLEIVRNFAGIKKYASLHKLLTAVDFAGKLYEPEETTF